MKSEISYEPQWTHCDGDTTHVLTAKNLHVHYGLICALEDVSLEMKCGNAVALLGKNGAGKSTLLKTIAGLIKGYKGEVIWKDEALSKRQRRHEIAYLPQRSEVDWNFPITVRGLVEMGRYPHLGMWKRFSKKDQNAVDQALESLNLEDLQDRHIKELSGGQQQRTFIARALAGESHVILLDEPFAGLDVESQEHLVLLIRKLVDSHHLVIASHHDLMSTNTIFDEAVLLDRKIVASGNVEDVLAVVDKEKVIA